MEFPDLGRHCSEASCRRLDFLPLRCSACTKDFCGSHFAAAAHECTAPNDRNARPVPVCPLCDKPVAPRNAEERTALPDALVSAHLDRDCKEAKERKARCIVCKKKELVPIQCNDCGKSVCVKHRFTKDHSCPGKATTSSLAAEAAIRRTQQPARPAAATSRANPTATKRAEIQGRLSEDEALARALQASLAETEAGPAPRGRQLTQEELDRMAAIALSRELNGEQPARQEQQQADSNRSCTMS